MDLHAADGVDGVALSAAESFAVAVNVNCSPSMIVCASIASRTGAAFTSGTLTAKVFTSLNGGEPLSVTRMVTG